MSVRILAFNLILFSLIAADFMKEVEAAERYSVDDLLSMSIEDLVNVKVTSLSKREEKYMSTAGAVFVISNDDIRRSGARSIPEALRLAPGLQVSQTNMNQYQIGIRGQTDFFTDLLLVMVDNRPIYTTTFSGVWWVAQNYPLEDIERIEVVRGPGGAIWGSNAVNGVINIITKHAGASQGLRISGGGGTEDKGFGNISYSSKFKGLNYRVYGMNELRDGGLADRTNSVLTKGKDTGDFRRMNQQGFRLDWGANDATKVSLHGDIYRVTTGVSGYWMPIVTTPAQPVQEYTGLNHFSGRNLVFNIEKAITSDITFKGQLLYDLAKIDTKVIHEKKETFDGDFQVDIADVLNQNISLGMDLRQFHAHFDNTPQFQMPSRTTALVSFFVNDELSLLNGHLRIIGGLKMERNSYTKWVHQPSIKAIVSNDEWALWFSASEAARTPNDMENGLRWNLRRSAGKIVRQVGDGRAQTEKVTSYEVGARLHPSKDSLIELTAFQIFYKGVLDTWQDRSATNPL
ncbi:MAG: TonB-dependent receptor plug domain-containing protein, partial [Mariprofundaceae bacterium]|nr:TonB-dependent receptor plug domain-containing protein [Mariprofundaceae bacterium]